MHAELDPGLIQEARRRAEAVLLGNGGAWPFVGGFYVAPWWGAGA